MSRLDRPLNEWPQITDGALEWLDSFLTPDSLVFEWGSGGSTVYIAKRAKKIISIEHNSLWWQKVNATIQEQEIINAKCVLVEPEPLFEPEAPPRKAWANPKLCCSPYGIPRAIRKELGAVVFDYSKYVKAICRYSDKCFDLVFVDGRARTSCILYAYDKVRPGGFLMLDDAQRERYKKGKRLLVHWKSEDFYGTGKYITYKSWSTIIWRRPPDEMYDSLL